MGKDHNDNKKASQIVVTLILNSQQSWGMRKDVGWENVLIFKHTPTKCGRM